MDTNDPSSKSLWTCLKNPTINHEFAYPVFLNENEIILASKRAWITAWDFKYRGIYSNPVTYDIAQGIYKYNINQQESEIWIKYFPGNKIIEYEINNHTLSMDKINNIIYIYCINGLYEIDVDKQQSVRHTNVHCGEARSIFVNGKLHLINTSSKHFVWNEKTKKFDILHEFNQSFIHRKSHKIHYLQSKNVLLLFVCGFDDGIRIQYLYELSLCDLKWTKIDKYKEKENQSGYTSVITNDEKYIVLIGKLIYLLEIGTWIITKTNIQVPIGNSLYYALSSPRNCSTINHKKYDLLVSGYIRMFCVANKKLNIPKETTDITRTYYDIQYILLFEQNDTATAKWKISVDNAFNAIF